MILSCKVLKDIQKFLFSIQTAKACCAFMSIDISDHSGRKSEKSQKKY
jgi:hypothetical protein